MKLKSVLKFGLPIFGVATLAVTLPLALTSCSDSKDESKPITFTKNLEAKTSVAKGQNYLELSVEAKSNSDKELEYQWFYKPASSQDEKANLASDEENNPMQGFIKIENNPTANQATLKIANEIDKGNDYQLVCVVYEKQDAVETREDQQEENNGNQIPNYLFSNVTTISVNNDKVLNSVDSVSPTTISALNISSSLTSLDDILEEDKTTVKPESGFFTSTAKSLGFTETSGSYPQIASMKLIEEPSTTTINKIFTLEVSLAESYTWSVETFKMGEGLDVTKANTFTINNNGELVISNLTSGIKTKFGNLSTYLKFFADRTNENDLSATIQQIQSGIKGETYSSSSNSSEFKKLVSALGFDESEVKNVEVKLINSNEYKNIDGWNFPIEFTFNFNKNKFENQISYENSYKGLSQDPIKYSVSANEDKLTLTIQNNLTVKIHVENENSSGAENTLTLKSVNDFITKVKTANSTCEATTYTIKQDEDGSKLIEVLAKQLQVPTDTISKIDFVVTSSGSSVSVQPTVFFTKGVIMDYMSAKFKNSGSTIAQAGYNSSGTLAKLTFTAFQVSGLTIGSK